MKICQLIKLVANIGSMEGKNVPRRRFHIAVMNKKTAKRISDEISKSLSGNIRKIIKPGMKTKL